jgi:hypothetical protein
VKARANLLFLSSMARFLAAALWVKAALPPKPIGLRTRTMQTFCTPATVPSQVMPRGICTRTVKSVDVRRLRPTRPGTSSMTSAVWKAEASVPPEVGSIEAETGPAPSWLICYRSRESECERIFIL